MRSINRKRRAGFTLIELLVVIGIVVILSVVVVITLNPTELLKQARDSNRISDMGTIKSALSLYLADVSSTSLYPSANPGSSCFVHASSGAAGTGCAGRFLAGTVSSTASVAVNGGGWIPVNFAGITGGSPISNEPIDPSNSGANFYAYRASTTASTFELNANLESTKYNNYGTTDGGDNATTSVYEVGTNNGVY